MREEMCKGKERRQGERELRGEEGGGWREGLKTRENNFQLAFHNIKLEINVIAETQIWWGTFK
jgi:hypothetical protein